MYHKIFKREINSKSNSNLVCYVAIYSSHYLPNSEKNKSAIEHIILGNKDIDLHDDRHGDRKAYAKEKDAEEDVLDRIKNDVLRMKKDGSSPDDIMDEYKMINKEYLDSYEKKDLKKNAYWIFTVEGNATDITNLLSSYEKSYEEFSSKILFAVNKGNDTVISASELRESKVLKP